MTAPDAFVNAPEIAGTEPITSYMSGGSLVSGLLGCLYFALVWYFLPTYGAARTTCLVGLTHSAANLLSAIGSFTIAHADQAVYLVCSRTVEILKLVTQNTQNISMQNFLEFVPFSVLLAPLLWLFLLFLLAYAPAWAWKTRPRPPRTRCRAGRVADMGVNRWSRAFRNLTPPRLRGRCTPKAPATTPSRDFVGPPRKSSLRERLRTRHRQSFRRVPRAKDFDVPGKYAPQQPVQVRPV